LPVVAVVAADLIPGPAAQAAAQAAQYIAGSMLLLQVKHIIYQ
jgi:hypothetical protein